MSIAESHPPTATRGFWSGAHKHLFVGSGAGHFPTSQFQIFAVPTLKGILGSLGRLAEEANTRFTRGIAAPQFRHMLREESPLLLAVVVPVLDVKSVKG
jgi:hypothetical protein